MATRYEFLAHLPTLLHADCEALAIGASQELSQVAELPPIAKTHEWIARVYARCGDRLCQAVEDGDLNFYAVEDILAVLGRRLIREQYKSVVPDKEQVADTWEAFKIAANNTIDSSIEGARLLTRRQALARLHRKTLETPTDAARRISSKSCWDQKDTLEDARLQLNHFANRPLGLSSPVPDLPRDERTRQEAPAPVVDALMHEHLTERAAVTDPPPLIAPRIPVVKTLSTAPAPPPTLREWRRGLAFSHSSPEPKTAPSPPPMPAVESLQPTARQTLVPEQLRDKRRQLVHAVKDQRNYEDLKILAKRLSRGTTVDAIHAFIRGDRIRYSQDHLQAFLDELGLTVEQWNSVTALDDYLVKMTAGS